jgi:hypothetical protein
MSASPPSSLRRSKRLKKSHSMILPSTTPSNPTKPLRRTISSIFKNTKKSFPTNKASTRVLPTESKTYTTDRFLPFIHRPSYSSLLQTTVPEDQFNRNTETDVIISPLLSPTSSSTLSTDAYTRRLSHVTGMETPCKPLLDYQNASNMSNSHLPQSLQVSPLTSPFQKQLHRLLPPSPLKDLSTDKSLERSFPLLPERVLDAPGLRDDFYTSVLAWNVLGTVGVALGEHVYLWKEVSTFFCYF